MGVGLLLIGTLAGLVLLVVVIISVLRKRPAKKMALLMLAAFLVAIIGGVSIPSDEKPAATPAINQPKYSGPEVTYEISGTAESASITLSNPTGGTEQNDMVYLPRTYDYYSFPNDYLYISAQNNGETGSVKVSIYVKGNLFKTSTSTGSYVIASASGMK